jgi:GDP-4-dehydro-6-deoxy-D-mannose reductase
VSPPVLVTGATGFAGSHLVQYLSASCDVAAWGRRPPPGELAALARWQQVDLLDTDRVTAAIRELRPSLVFHCAGLPQVAESWTDTAAPLAVNVLGTHRLLEALRVNRVRCRMLVTGSAHVYAASAVPLDEHAPVGPASPYALSKLAQEQLALRAWAEDGIEVVVTRSFNHTGPRQPPSFVAPSIARQIASIEHGAGEPVIRVGNVDAVRDIMDVRDTVRAYDAAMRRGMPGTIYNVATGVGRAIREVVDTLVARARVPIRVESDPARMRPSDIPVLIGDATRLRDATGWTSRIPFDETLEDLLEYWRHRAASGAA